jgi:hypothetical protein
MKPEEDFDLRQLWQRGWRPRMVEALLGKEDYRAPVNHYRNFSGKKMFEKWRVEAAEASDEFRRMFTARCRGPLGSFGQEVLARSRALEAEGAQWKGPPPLTDIEFRAAAMATWLQLARMRGFRTPHKC